MSKFNLVAVAIAAALAAPAAFATTVTVGGGAAPDILPTNAFVDNTIVAKNTTKAMAIVADATDVYLGRTTGYNIRLTLSVGKFSATPAATNVGSAGATNTVAGGGNGFNTVTYAVVPAGGGVVAGDGISFAATAININNVAALGAGGSISVAVQVFDPVGGNQLGSTVNATLINTAQGWVVTYTGGASTQRVDVGSASAKRYFGTATVGSGLEPTLFNAGQVAIATNPVLTDIMTLNTATATAPVSITGTDFSAFKIVTGGTGGSVYLAVASTCAANIANIGATVAVGNQSAAIAPATTVNQVNAAGYLCFDSNAITAIAAQSIGSSVVVAQASTISAPVASSGTTLTSMTYNGSVINVDHFNPASNTSQESYLRITNGSGTAGLVSVSGICDNGVARPTVASFTLGAGESRLLTASTLESGTGLTTGTGACAVPGKSRLTVTGEFSSLAVQNFLRNISSSGAINTNVNNQN